MSTAIALDSFLSNLKRSGLIESGRLDQFLADLPGAPTSAFPLAKALVHGGLLTPFQAGHLLKGRTLGFLIAGKYKVLDLLGTGGMGAVYLVEHVRLHCLYAMKTLPRERIKDPAALARFYREARATAAINHPNIVRTHDVDQDRDLHFLVMDYVDGCDLQRVIDVNGPLEVSAAAHLISQTATGLQQIHNTGWVHRDVKPGNILITREGVVKILDLGLARLFDEAKSVTQQYSESGVLGTADYLAPELAIDGNVLDIRSDLYSLGVVMYHLLAGRTPFGKGSVAQKLMWANLRQPDPLEQLRPDLPPELIAIVMRLLAKEPADRFQYPNEVVDALVPWTQEFFGPPPSQWFPAPNVAAATVTARSGGSRPTLSNTPNPRPESSSRIGTSRKRSPETGSSDGAQPQSGSKNPILQESPLKWHAWTLRSPTHVTALAAAVLAVVCGIGWALIGGQAKDSTKDPVTSKPSTADFSHVLGNPPSGNPPIYASGGNNTLAKGVERAKSGDWIVVPGNKVEGTLDIDGSTFGREVTIIGVVGPNGPPVWRPQNSAGRSTPLIRVTGVERLVIENLTLDGEGRLDHLVEIRGRCPGLKLTKLQMKGFQKRAVVLDGARGEADGEIVLDHLRVTVDPAVGLAEAAVAFRPSLPGVAPAVANQHVRVTDCRFEGGFATAVSIEGPSVYLSFQRNRFYRCRDGFRLTDNPAADRVRLTVEGNTLVGVERVLNLERLPSPDENNRFVFRNNLFVRAPILVRAGRTLGADDQARLFVGSAGNIHDPDSGREGGTLLGARAMTFNPLPTDPADDNQFLKYPADQPLATTGIGRQPVGVPQR